MNVENQRNDDEENNIDLEMKRKDSSDEVSQEGFWTSISQTMSDRCAEVDAFGRSLMHLTIPILVTLPTPTLFFLVNGTVMFLCVWSGFFEAQGRLNAIIHRLYFLAFHLCFVVIDVARDGLVFEVAGIIALSIVVVCMLHEVMELLYRAIRLLHQALLFFREKHRVANLLPKSTPKHDSEKDL